MELDGEEVGCRSGRVELDFEEDEGGGVTFEEDETQGKFRSY